MSDNYLELIDLKTIINEKLVNGTEETIRRYFRKDILFAHNRNGASITSYRGSVIVRYDSLKRVKMGGKRISLETIGTKFKKVAGEEDEFIVSKLKENKSLKEISDEFVTEVRYNLNK